MQTHEVNSGGASQEQQSMFPFGAVAGCPS